MEVSTKILRHSFQILMDHVESDGTKTVRLDKDFYWFIPTEAVYDPYVEPSNFTLGQLDADYKELVAISESATEPISYGLVWLAAILRAVGERRIE